ncbi:hypothetical protein HMI54_000455 [Coelomomyces lativittatus]|nr:hypothetical protein HMI56_003223 [Coelomomyces lativittatus]KAJ1511854.1 hypothetical protein HMI54_000455 [Coelomomyces lativittatus]KAJ1518444.1 hypothetical protein HMI55_000004 [Coelomomyces lativittatus]
MFQHSQRIRNHSSFSLFSLNSFPLSICSWFRLRHTSTISDKLTKKPIVLQENDLNEQFVKGSGNGGQKVNKSSNCVILTHLPTNIQVRSHDTRSLHQNRSIARKRLIEKLDLLWNGDQSKLQQKIKVLRKKKMKKTQRSKKKYGSSNEPSDEEEFTSDHTPSSTDNEEQSPTSNENISISEKKQVSKEK